MNNKRPLSNKYQLNNKRQPKGKVFSLMRSPLEARNICVNSQKWSNLEIEPYFYSLFCIQVLKKCLRHTI
ncbi:UNVERIFIED_CONTAM: hypothetical protein GTU68_058113 [Idotea baltica]|nr:hypothetical protein [Idotea baltica]